MGRPVVVFRGWRVVWLFALFFALAAAPAGTVPKSQTAAATTAAPSMSKPAPGCTCNSQNAAVQSQYGCLFERADCARPFYRISEQLFLALIVAAVLLLLLALLLIININKRLKTSRILADKERLYHILVDNMQVGISFIDKNFNIVTTNRKQAEMINLTPPDLVNRKCYEVFEHRDQPCPHCPGVIAMHDDQPAYVETKLLTANGRENTVSIHAFPFKDSNGEITGYVELVEDITPRRKSEEQAQDQLWFFEGLNRINLIIQKEHDLASMLKQLLATMLTQFRCNRVSLISSSGPQPDSVKIDYIAASPNGVPVHPNTFVLDSEFRKNTWKQINDSAEPIRFEPSSADPWLFPDTLSVMVIAIHPRNNPVWLLEADQCRLKHPWSKIEIALFKEIANRIADGLSSLISTTELIRNAEDIRITLNSLGEGVIATDQDNRIVRMNPVAERLTGWEFAEAEGRQLESVFNIRHPFSHTPALKSLAEIISEGGNESADSDIVLISRDGQERRISQSSTPIRSGELICGLVTVFRDITSQRRMEEELHQSQKMESVGRLAGGVAHDFNNMLCAMLGSATALQKRLAPQDNNRKLLDIIINSSKHAASLTEKLLTFSRKGNRYFTVTDVHRLISDAVEILRHSIDRKIDIQLRLEAAESTIKGDVSQINNALLNLGINARDAMPEGGQLTIVTANVDLDETACHSCSFKLSPGHYLKVSVIDTGTGMSPEIQAQIFEPFFTTKEVGQGTGLGLSATYGTMIDHSGAIKVESTPGHGSQFHLYFPVFRNTDETVPLAAPSEPAPSAGCIMVVDDEPTVRIVAAEIINDLGYEVITAENGREALKAFIANQDKINLVLLDMIMPVMNGRDCFLELRRLKPNLKVVMSSGFTHDTMISQLKEEGVNGFVAKPYQIKDLTSTIGELLDIR